MASRAALLFVLFVLVDPVCCLTGLLRSEPDNNQFLDVSRLVGSTASEASLIELVAKQDYESEKRRAAVPAFPANSTRPIQQKNDIVLAELNNVKKRTCWVTSDSGDGFGHQVHGMITIMALHGLSPPRSHQVVVQYDATPRKFHFDHITNPEVVQELTTFMQGAMQSFSKERCSKYSCNPKQNRHKRLEKQVGISPILDGKCAVGATYVVDNAFYGFAQPGKTSNLTSIVANIVGFSKLFRRLLPYHNLPNGFTVVAHIRLTDGSSRGYHPATRIQGAVGKMKARLNSESGVDVRARSVLAIKRILSQLDYDNFIVHTDNVTEAESLLHDQHVSVTKIYGPETSVLLVFSQLVNADVLIASESSLSQSAALLRDSERQATSRIFIPAETLHKNGIKVLPQHTTY